MKKIILLGLMMIFLISGCGKVTSDKAIKDFEDKVTGSKAYEIKGTMEINSDEDVFKYSINIAYKKDDFYKVSLVNLTNNHEQVILKNSEGTFVVTPSLNKSFKFQSEWPKNSSQAYLLASLLNDLKNTEKPELVESKDGYELIANVNYPNNPDLKTEKLYFDKDMNLMKVEVLNEDKTVKIKVIFDSIDYKANFADDYFNLDKIVDEDCCKTDEGSESTETSKLEDIVYPLYIPANTYLTSKDTIEIPGGERVILTFAGEKNFILVEETTKVNEELEIIPVYGEPLQLNETIGALSGNSLHWSSNKVDYYLTGEDLSSEELMTIATSLANTTGVAGEK